MQFQLTKSLLHTLWKDGELNEDEYHRSVRVAAFDLGFEKGTIFY